jgi:hypothetical protein
MRYLSRIKQIINYVLYLLMGIYLFLILVNDIKNSFSGLYLDSPGSKIIILIFEAIICIIMVLCSMVITIKNKKIFLIFPVGALIISILLIPIGLFFGDSNFK